MVHCSWYWKRVNLFFVSFRFEDLKVWHIAVDLSNEIDLLVKSFPMDERFSLASQMKRTADSVVLNIAEGSTGQTIPEFKRFPDIALRSAIEVVAGLFLAEKRNYIEKEKFRNFYNKYEMLSKMITKLRD